MFSIPLYIRKLLVVALIRCGYAPLGGTVATRKRPTGQGRPPSGVPENTMTDYDNTDQKSPGTTRRRFLGAAAALGLLGTVPGTTEATRATNIQHGDHGTTRAIYETRTTSMALWDVYFRDSDGASINVNGYHFDDEEFAEVEVTITNNHADLTVSIPTAEARELGADLQDAAAVAEGRTTATGGDGRGDD